MTTSYTDLKQVLIHTKIGRVTNSNKLRYVEFGGLNLKSTKFDCRIRPKSYNSVVESGKKHSSFGQKNDSFGQM